MGPRGRKVGSRSECYNHGVGVGHLLAGGKMRNKNL
jgi:hypothetical protein